MNDEIINKWQDLRYIFINYNEILKDILINLNGQKTIRYEHYLWDIIARYRYNIESMIALIPLVIEDSRLKLSFNLITRSLASDVITSFYLISLYDEDLRPTEALKNELDILSAEYMMFLKETQNIELNTDDKEYDDDLKNLSITLFNEEGNLKKKKELRKTTEEYFKSKLNNSGNFISENQKYTYIKKVSKSYDLSKVFLAYKYYSQFQHFNLMSKKLIENETKIELTHLSNIIDSLVNSVDVVLIISNISVEKYRSQLKQLHEL